MIKPEWLRKDKIGRVHLNYETLNVFETWHQPKSLIQITPTLSNVSHIYDLWIEIECGWHEKSPKFTKKKIPVTKKLEKTIYKYTILSIKIIMKTIL